MKVRTKGMSDFGFWILDFGLIANPKSKIQNPKSKRSLGQNFLTDRTVPPRIAEAARVEPSDHIVEVGPGLGALTEELAGRLDPEKGGRLVAVELDHNLLPILGKRFANVAHLSIVHGNVLDIAPGGLRGGSTSKPVAN